MKSQWWISDFHYTGSGRGAYVVVSYDGSTVTVDGSIVTVDGHQVGAVVAYPVVVDESPFTSTIAKMFNLLIF